ncbi:MAG: hypothetical protein A4E57_01797 [Syntrophorhabdaceae bacterium PtaU1.Bin034]|nr:MAG: hypothetical protein A4E57_01797 [Syntrophorhabdaceae bacterium PtaU1.Bin034]
MTIKKNNRGFTYIELVFVIVALGILTLAVMGRNRFGIEEYSALAEDQLIADIRYVQLRAMGTKKSQSILFTLNSPFYSIREGATVIEQKKLSRKLSETESPLDVIIRTANFSGSNVLTFNSLGEPTFSVSANGKVTIGDSTNTYRTLTVTPITGRVQQ